MAGVTTQMMDPADGVVWIVPMRPTDRPARPRLGRRASFVGVLLALVIAAIPAIAALVNPDLSLGFVLSTFGTPAAAVVAWRLAPTITNGDAGDALDRAFVMGFATFFVAVVLCSVLWSISSAFAPEATGGAVTGILLAALEGFVLAILGCFVASPTLMITIPSAMVWVLLMRRLPRRVLGPMAAR